MIEELGTASSRLRDALDKYLLVCSAIRKSHIASPSNIAQEFAERLKDEAHMLLDYESKFQEAKSAITWARNSVALAPANILPPEILARIFRFVLAKERCSGRDEDDITRYSKNRESLSHVCSRWRQVALASRDLWTHIDFCPERTVNDLLVPRAQAYIKRSDPLPLYIHIDESVDWEELEYWGTSMRFESSENTMALSVQLIASVATRTRALDLTINCGYVDFHREALESCLKGCTLGILSQLVIRRAAGYDDYCRAMTTSDGTLSGNYHGNAKRSVPLGISEQQLEDVLFRCTTLSFDGLFAPWSSRAYHGLTELRLTRCQKIQDGFILESAFVSMLKASPQLRILMFDLALSSPLPDSTSIGPIPLIDLETLAVGVVGERALGQFFRWIVPGSKPLVVLIEWSHGVYGDEFGTFTKDQLGDFFARSNVERISVAETFGSYQIDDLRELAPKVSDLTLEFTDWDEIL